MLSRSHLPARLAIFLPAALWLLLLSSASPAQQPASKPDHQTTPAAPASSSTSSSSTADPDIDDNTPSASVKNPKQTTDSAQRQAPQAKPPALVDPNGPAISLQTSEAMFDVAVALNACGYDAGLDTSDPVRQHVRDEVNQALLGSEKARDARDRVCTFIASHRLSSSSRDLAQYVSLALYLTPPPELAPSVDVAEMPPDSTQVAEIAPLLSKFADNVNLHVIWLAHRPQYDQQANALHDPLSKMIDATNVYLKMPTSIYDGRRFLVVLEPMFDPGQINVRVYGTDYVVVASPVKGQIRMDDVRHAYLHYEIEPLLYARAGAIDRLLPVLKTVRDAPLDFAHRSDIVLLVIESMIKAIEARTMNTGVVIHKVPADVRRSDIDREEHERQATLQQAEAVRVKTVQHDMAEGYVLTQYFYDAFGMFEHSPASLKEDIGEMVYGMDVDAQISHIKNIKFLPEGSDDVVSRTPHQLRGLELAEVKMLNGDAAAASQLAQQALKDRTDDPGRANYILGLCALQSKDVEGAVERFETAAKLSRDPRTLAWSHIYLGRIYDINDERDSAVAEYKAALTVRDGQADTKAAAERGLKQPYAPPAGAHPAEKDEDPAPGKSSPK